MSAKPGDLCFIALQKIKELNTSRHFKSSEDSFEPRVAWLLLIVKYSKHCLNEAFDKSEAKSL